MVGDERVGQGRRREGRKREQIVGYGRGGEEVRG